MCPTRTRGYRWLSRLDHRDLERQYERCDIALWRLGRGNVWKQRTTEASLGFPTRIGLLVLSHRESQIETHQTYKWLSCIQSREEAEGLTCPKIPDWTSEGRRRIPPFCISSDIFPCDPKEKVDTYQSRKSKQISSTESEIRILPVAVVIVVAVAISTL